MPLSLRRILCPIDFSDTSARALRYAAATAEWFGAELAVVHVHRLAVPVSMAAGRGSGAGLAESSPPSSDERDQLATNLRSFVNGEVANYRALTWHLDEHTDVPEALLARARRMGADLIVVGTHGRAGLQRLLLGSVAERLLRAAPCAVLAVPPEAPATPAQPPRVDRVLCGVDFSPSSQRALECARAVADRARAALTVAHIVELPPDVPDYPQADLSRYREARFAEAQAAMQTVLAGSGRTGDSHAHAHADALLLAGRAGPELLRVAAEQQARLIVMGVQGRSSADLLMFGSVTHHVLRQAPCPVLAIRA